MAPFCRGFLFGCRALPDAAVRRDGVGPLSLLGAADGEDDDVRAAAGVMVINLGVLDFCSISTVSPVRGSGEAAADLL